MTKKINPQALKAHLRLTGQTIPLMIKFGGLEEGVGSDHSQPCPFCGGTDRYWYSADSEKCYCRDPEGRECPAHKGVDIFSLVQHKQSMTFRDALKLIAHMSGFTTLTAGQKTEPTPTSDLKQTDKSESTFKTWELTEDSGSLHAVQTHRPEISFAEYKRMGSVCFSDARGSGIAVPMYDNNGELSGYVLYYASGGKPMILNGSKSGIVGDDARDALLSKRQARTAVLKCAGVSDCLAMMKAIADDGLDDEYYVFTNGAGEMENPDKFDPILRPALEGQNAVVIADNDKTGETGSQKWAGHLAAYAANVRIIRPPTEWSGKPVKDVRDFLAAAGATEVWDWFHNAIEQAEPVKPNEVSKLSETGESPILIRASEVEEKEIAWLWLNKIALGMLSLLTGLSGVGKSYWTVFMTATITTGRNWPDGTPCEKGSVLFFYGEEGIADTYKQRFRVNGVNDEHVVFMKGKLTLDSSNKLSEADVTVLDVAVIEKAIKETAETTGLPVKMIVIDPISNYWDAKTNENSNADVRAALRPLQLLAEETGVAFVMIQHTGKGDKEHAQQQVLGSTAIVAICRAVWGILVDLDDKDTLLFVPVKINCGYNHTAVSYRITPPDGTVEIIETGIRKTADDVLCEQRKARSQRGRKPDKRNDCEDRLLEILADGKKVSSTDIKATLEAEGFKSAMIDTIKRELGVKSIPEGKSRLWWLPSDSEVECID